MGSPWISPGRRSRRRRMTGAQTLPQLQTQADLPTLAFVFGMQPRHEAGCTKGPPSDGTGWAAAAAGPGNAPASLLHPRRQHSRPMQKVPKCHALIGGLERGHQGVKASRRTQPRLQHPALIRPSKIIIPVLRASGDADVLSTKRRAFASLGGVDPAGLRFGITPAVTATLSKRDMGVRGVKQEHRRNLFFKNNTKFRQGSQVTLAPSTSAAAAA